MNKKLCLSDNDKKIGGVCGGIAEYFGLESVILRLIWLLLILIFRWLPILIYFILWAVLPKKEKGE